MSEKSSPRKKALVTGAAGGMGLACALKLRSQGWDIVTLDRSPVTDAGLEGVPNINVDLADVDHAIAAARQAIETLGGIDALLHFAAVWSGANWEEATPAEWDRVLDINVKGSFFLVQTVAHAMKAQGSGRIVLVASDSAKIGGVAGGVAYVASKGGTIALTRQLAKALGPHGITVNAINPGVTDTPMTVAWPQALKDDVVRRTPLGRLGRPDDVGDVAAFLASDDARFITGEIVEVNGGFYFG